MLSLIDLEMRHGTGMIYRVPECLQRIAMGASVTACHLFEGKIKVFDTCYYCLLLSPLLRYGHKVRVACECSSVGAV